MSESWDEVDVVIIQIDHELAEKVHANPEGLRVWLAGDAVPFPKKPAAMWQGTAIYNRAEKLWQMPRAKRIKLGVR
jgi:hypothetical protein